jgi:cyclic pyranopterin monophosphate synthase
MSSGFSHFDAAGQARMVNVGGKLASERLAVAEGQICLQPQAYEMVKAGTLHKGDVLGVARLAGIMAAKQTASLIPLCHPLVLTAVDLSFFLDDVQHRIGIQATVRVSGKTGVEMEALTAVSVAALTIYDMCKAVDKEMEISAIRLIKKSGGKSGTFSRAAQWNTETKGS